MSKKADADPALPAIPTDPPASPDIVKKASGKLPWELDVNRRLKQIESNHSKLEDRVGGLDGVVKGINDFLEGLGGSPTRSTAPSQGKGVFEDIADDILGDD